MWNKKDEKCLIKLNKKGMSSYEIGYEMGKTEDSIRNKMKRLGLKKPVDISIQPKVLVFDIETAPMTTYTWGLYDENIGINQIKEDWFILGWSAKWLGEKEIMSMFVNPRESQKRDDKRIMKGLWKLMSEADFVIAHNGDQFDVKKSLIRFAKHGLQRPSRFRSIDTKKIAKKVFGATSNKLDYLCGFFGLERKMQTGGFELWTRCLNGEKSALEQMEEYCINDVIILEQLYLKLRSYDTGHPNFSVLQDGAKTCPICGGSRLVKEGRTTTNTNVYDVYRCECGALCRLSTPKKQEKSLFR